MAERRGLVIGVTGAPGSGKSSVAAAFASLGARVIGVDEIGHELLADPGVLDEIHDTFSSGVFRIMDGQVSRKKLAEVVFSDAQELERLHRILHPRMVERVKAELESLRASLPPGRGVAGGGLAVAVIDAALLFEMGLDEICDRVVLVSAPREMRLERLRCSRGWDEAELERRERAQLDDDSRSRRADAALGNSLTIDDMREVVRTYWEEWT